MKQFGEQRHCEVEKLENVEIFFDRSVVEIFLNDGEKAMTSRFFIENRENCLETSRNIEIQLATVAKICEK